MTLTRIEWTNPRTPKVGENYPQAVHRYQSLRKLAKTLKKSHKNNGTSTLDAALELIHIDPYSLTKPHIQALRRSDYTVCEELAAILDLPSYQIHDRANVRR